MLYLILVALGILAAKQLTSPTGAMSPAERLTYEGLLSADSPSTSAEEFLRYATDFDAKGLRYEANILRKRARIASLPPAQRAAIKDAFQTGLRSKNPTDIRVLANSMESEGYFGNAEYLRDLANSLETGSAILAAQRLETINPTRVSNVSTGGGTASVSVPMPGTAAALIASATPQELAAARRALGLSAEPSAASAGAPTAGAPTAGAPSAGPPSAGPTASGDFVVPPPPRAPVGRSHDDSPGKPTLADFERMAAAEAASPGSSRSM